MLGEFDMDYVVQSAKTLISPIVLVDLKADNYKMTVIHKEFTQLGEPIIELQQLGDLQLDNDKSQNTSLLVSKPIKILNSHGIHARPAAVLSSKAKEFDCDIFLEKNGKFANLKSVVALLGLAVNMGDNIRIHAQTQ